jgi:uncharacterized membrane protein (UPF0127 family)
MLSRALRWSAVSLVLLMLTAACGANEGADPATTPSAETALTATATAETATSLERETLAIRAANGRLVEAFAEMAVTPEQRAQGLMGRTELDADSGMLLVIEPPGRGFWMKDTLIALTIAFIDTCGEIVDLIDMEPLSEEVKNASRPYGFALEMEQDWFSENGIVVGDVVELPPGLLPAEC